MQIGMHAYRPLVMRVLKCFHASRPPSHSRRCCLRAPIACTRPLPPSMSHAPHLCRLYLVLHPPPPALPVSGRVLMQRLLL
jgi:hypothetical protein